MFNCFSLPLTSDKVAKIQVKAFIEAIGCGNVKSKSIDSWYVATCRFSTKTVQKVVSESKLAPS